jgi:hypothetical protein
MLLTDAVWFDVVRCAQACMISAVTLSTDWQPVMVVVTHQSAVAVTWGGVLLSIIGFGMTMPCTAQGIQGLSMDTTGQALCAVKGLIAALSNRQTVSNCGPLPCSCCCFAVVLVIWLTCSDAIIVLSHVQASWRTCWYYANPSTAYR